MTLGARSRHAGYLGPCFPRSRLGGVGCWGIEWDWLDHLASDGYVFRSEVYDVPRPSFRARNSITLATRTASSGDSRLTRRTHADRDRGLGRMSAQRPVVRRCKLQPSSCTFRWWGRQSRIKLLIVVGPWSAQ